MYAILAFKRNLAIQGTVITFECQFAVYRLRENDG